MYTNDKDYKRKIQNLQSLFYRNKHLIEILQCS
jgi:hypothetical protein